jgi:hypothetical protein
MYSVTITFLMVCFLFLFYKYTVKLQLKLGPDPHKGGHYISERTDAIIWLHR